MKRFHLALLSALVLTFALVGQASQASASTYQFLGFYAQQWYFYDPPPHTVGGWGGYGTTSAADVGTSAGGVQTVHYTSYENTTVGKLISAGWSGCGPAGCCPADDMSMAFEIYRADTMQLLGIVTVGHLKNVRIAVGGWAWNGLAIADQHPGGGCSTGPHVHVEKTSTGQWVNCWGINNELQAAIRWGGGNSDGCVS